MEQFKPRPDSGSLNASASKRSDKSPDYFGEITLNLRDMTNIRIEDGLHIVKINGWKKVAKSGKTYLSLAVNRYVPEGQAQSAAQDRQPPAQELPDEDIPF